MFKFHLNFTVSLSFCSSGVQLRSVNHAQLGPIADSFVFIEGQDMMFVCNATPTNRGVDWVVVELTGGDGSASRTLSLANSQTSLRIGSSATNNAANPADITVVAAMLGHLRTHARTHAHTHTHTHTHTHMHAQCTTSF